MSTSTVQLAPCVPTHAWNSNSSKICYSPNTNEVVIADAAGKIEATLSEHDQVVTGIDWAPKTNRIVTSSQDRNAYVWSYNDAEKKWMPTLVILRINRAATAVKWSPEENKFAVASGAKCVSVCYFEEDHDWWVSKHIKKPIRSTVLSVDWHPNNVLIATGSSDFKCRIFSGFIKGIDQKGAGATGWGSDLSFADVVAEIDVGAGWVHDVRFSPSGDQLAVVTHNSSFVLAEPEGKTTVIKMKDLPLRSIIWLSEKSIVCAGYDYIPMLFCLENGAWVFKKKLDEGKKKAAGPTSGTNSAFLKFQQATRVGSSSSSTAADDVNTIHKNAITCLCPKKKEGDRVTEFTSTGYDGQLITWSQASLEKEFAGLKIA
eukprot:GCRY01000142.1.p1 GENE.GCRY01000142.1~~GCRY01000142.1.p1  ORF type:complete len:373 (-),score=78.19 GCRY01000142.1:65-1183(-)